LGGVLIPKREDVEEKRLKKLASIVIEGGEAM
jgi:hypothetical protein